jgi:1-acyl-sn-glycerol-3-phosphate acyltransferase
LTAFRSDGPVVLVANHPHGLVDGMILANLIGRRRPDYRILTRALLTGLDESAASFMIPVPFPHEPDAQAKMLEMRAAAMSHLDNNGLIALFPSGAVAASDTMFGPRDRRRMERLHRQDDPQIRRHGRALLLHRVEFPLVPGRQPDFAGAAAGPADPRGRARLRQAAGAVIGAPIGPDEWEDRIARKPREFMAWLRERTLSLKDAPDA